ncbi:MAG: hypothetical protein WBA57_15860 [Elainellaceae cyanobacterium]
MKQSIGEAIARFSLPQSWMSIAIQVSNFLKTYAAEKSSICTHHSKYSTKIL